MPLDAPGSKFSDEDYLGIDYGLEPSLMSLGIFSGVPGLKESSDLRIRT